MSSHLSSQLSPKDLDVFFSMSQNLLAVVRTDGCFERVNTTFEQILGWQSAKSDGWSKAFFFQAEDGIRDRDG